jgi:Phosphotransferase system, HPr-related proteins
LGACIKCGDEIEFICEGPDEEQALKAMIQLVESGLGE